MKVKKILLITLIAVAIISSVSAVSAGLFDGLFGEEQKDNVVEVDHIKFNTTNVTKFKLENETKADGAYYKWYLDENKTGYNVHIWNFSKAFKTNDNANWEEVLKEYKNDPIDNLPSQTINGIVVYTTTANVGDNVGQPRYLSYIENRDANTLVSLWSPDPNETAKMALSLKFK